MRDTVNLKEAFKNFDDFDNVTIDTANISNDSMVNAILTEVYLHKKAREKEIERIRERNGTIGLICLFVFLAWIANRAAKLVKRIDNPKTLFTTYSSTPPSPSVTGDPYFVYHGKELGFSTLELARILEKHFPYYQALTHDLKQRFIGRLKDFIADKQFIIWTKDGLKEMPVLISATAIQLTFGLSKYMFPFFENMQIHPEEYFADNSMRILAGHVQGNVVTVSWKHLLQGIKNGTDGSNVGLHEMAHAFYVQCTEADFIKGKRIIHHLNEIMAEGQDVYDLREKGTLLFSDYAFKDLQEFWAESIEIFFEKPKEMQVAYPELFESLTELLQQNPTNSAQPLMA